MNKKTLEEMRTLAMTLFESAAQLVGFFVLDEEEQRRELEELKKTRTVKYFTFRP